MPVSNNQAASPAAAVSSKEVPLLPLHTITLPASIESLSEINAHLEHLLQNEFEPFLLKTQLVVEELLANICSYAYEGGQGTAVVACGVVNFDGHQAIMLQLTDKGKPYDPFAKAVQPDLEADVQDRAIGGLGVFLVKEIATHYVYMRIDDCNQTQIILDVSGNKDTE